MSNYDAVKTLSPYV